MSDTKNTSTQEIWKDLNGLDPNYTVRVSNTGKVTLRLHGTKDSSGRLYVNIAGADIPIDYLVAKAFIANPYSGNDIRHIDNNQSNNRASNLQWFINEEMPSGFSYENAILSKAGITNTTNTANTVNTTNTNNVTNGNLANTNEVSQTSGNTASDTASNITPDTTTSTTDTPKNHRYIPPKALPTQYNYIIKNGDEVISNSKASEIKATFTNPEATQENPANSDSTTTGATTNTNTYSSYYNAYSYGAAAVYTRPKKNHSANIPENLMPENYDKVQKSQQKPDINNPNIVATEIEDAPKKQLRKREEKTAIKSPFVNYEQPAIQTMKPVEAAKEVEQTVELDMSKGSQLIYPKDHGIIIQKEGVSKSKAKTFDDWTNEVDLNQVKMKAQQIINIPKEKVISEGVRGGAYNKKKVCCTLRNGAEKVFDSVSEAAAFCGVDHSAISKCCRGQCGLIKGMQFRYVELKDIETVLDMYLDNIKQAEDAKPEIDLTPRKRGRPKGSTKEVMRLKREQEERIKKKSKRKNMRT